LKSKLYAQSCQNSTQKSNPRDFKENDCSHSSIPESTAQFSISAMHPVIKSDFDEDDPHSVSKARRISNSSLDDDNVMLVKKKNINFVKYHR
jgi:hypothetical protein